MSPFLLLEGESWEIPLILWRIGVEMSFSHRQAKIDTSIFTVSHLKRTVSLENFEVFRHCPV